MGVLAVWIHAEWDRHQLWDALRAVIPVAVLDLHVGLEGWSIEAAVHGFLHIPDAVCQHLKVCSRMTFIIALW